MFRFVAHGRPSPVTILATLALFVSLGGVAYAAGTIRSADIVDNTIQSVDLKDGGAVKGVDVVNDSLTGADINESTLQGVSRKLYAIATAGAAPVTMRTVGGYTIAAYCADSGDVENALVLQVAGPAGVYDYWQIAVDDQNQPSNETAQRLKTGGGLISANSWTHIGGEYGAGGLLEFGDYGDYGRAAGTVILRSGTTVVQIDFQGAVFGPSGGNNCWFEGSATKLV